ncbi:ATPase complex subunit 8 (mitochondrion) [Kluyveromyces lactis]|jgi:F-type H+-transporting ATPase subunit 8|uniref:ATP synthase protein 8 n=2 Tax=Kluyveromyces TaxID=4910 RepID=ATP8_KLULA|nr:ATP synthase subunit 8 [Kluyveromyces marxianus DMKU3-1042]YP_054499.1 ATPase complex subunit 8 [Kluyveromyces lactis]Q00608.1 RecName: Full=ATP synthase protein 8; AltName: Full=A6L; AltName: Full=F-ATPase subunit 8 [Kluyveromyces lactis NRRL Y-1140]AAT64952.1 ATPase complex subunit 8 [Kluyveromyces lactis]CAA40770.1 ATPase subunit 8 [Kluyveromyces lactis]BAO42748.2 ATP synthase subunit 8 [Kluyveromyces marxianus DMKU3-1042]prf//1803222F A8 gene [Kluyveromyces lactis]|eukprot:YP_054499.1 ATPase complex subunit 8 (mitochondrion) [Kluyveromyces lactis]
MPQLVPFYFLNQLVYGFALVTILLVLFAQYFLPQILRLYVSRLFISKL